MNRLIKISFIQKSSFNVCLFFRVITGFFMYLKKLTF